MKFAILDSGPIISLTLNGVLHTLDLLKSKFPDVVFILTPQVKKEIIDKPMTIKKYELEAIKVQTLISKKIILMSTEFVSNNQLEKETQRILNLSNSTVRAGGENIQIVQIGEASCLAFANLCNCESVIVIDERVTRLLTESPQNLKAIMERKLHMSIALNQKNLKEFKSFKYIRSAELVYIVYKNGLYDYKKDKILLDALLYSLKYSGTSISSKEIEEMKSLG
jgi:predicted nucleic acid-binding protein